MHRTVIGTSALVALVGLAMPVLGQDSVSNAPFSFEGDALVPYDMNVQCSSFVVDLAPLTTSWGTRFGVAPVLKMGRANPAFYTSLASGMALSPASRTAVPFDPANYAVWTTPGQGVNPQRNSRPGTLPSANLVGPQFAMAVNDFETGPNGATVPFYDGVVGAIVNYDAADPSRLYVRRIVAGVNGIDATDENAAIGIGGVDAHGNVTFRADGFQANGLNPLADNNWYRIAMQDRACGTLNVIDALGPRDAAASVWVDLDPFNPGVGTGVVHTTPTIVPEQVGGPSIIGANFNNEFVFEASPGVTNATLGNRPLSYNQTRGGASFSQHVHFPGSVGTVGMVGTDTNIFPETQCMFIAGVDATGSPIASTALCIIDPATFLPINIIDNSDLFNPAVTYGPLWHDSLGNYRSQVAFQGGNGQVAIGGDADGNTLVAAMVQFLDCFTGQRNPTNGIVVARVDGAGGVEWTLAAHNKPGKDILDGPGGVAIGRLTQMFNVTGVAEPPCGGSVPNLGGPSISSPMIDSAGNIWFVGAVELFGPQPDFDTALIRAVYDAATFSYELELVLQLGDVFDGQNSGTPYQVQFLELVDTDSISSGAPFAGSINQSPAHGLAGPFDPIDPRSLGGIIVSARIVYDTDGVPGFTPASDENYRVLLYVGDVTEGECPCACDFDTVTGQNVCDIFDFLAFGNAFNSAEPCACDIDTTTGPGVCDIFDFLAFGNAFNQGC